MILAMAALYVLLLFGPWLVAAIGLIIAGVLTTRRVANPATQLAVALFTSLAGSLCLAQAVLHGLDDYFNNVWIAWLSVELILLTIPPAVMSFGALTRARIVISVGLLPVAGAAALLVLATSGIDRLVADPLVQANLANNPWAGSEPSYWDRLIRGDVFNSIAPALAIILYWIFWATTVGRLYLTRRSLPVLSGAVVGAATVALAAWVLWSGFRYVPFSAPSPVLTLQAALVLVIWRILILLGRTFCEVAPVGQSTASSVS